MTPIRTGDVRGLLRDSKLFPELPADVDDDTELALDSLGLLWLLHQVQERYGLAVDPADADLDDLTSIRRITAYLNEAGARAGLVGTAGPADEAR